MGRGTQILAEREKVATGFQQIRQRVEQLFSRLAQAEHQATLGLDGAVELLHAFEQFKGPAIIAFASTHLAIQARHRFGVVIEYLGSCFDHALHGPRLANKVGGQHFDDGPRSLTHRQHRAIEMLGTSVGQIVARNRRDHHVLEPQPLGGFGDALRFIEFQRRRLTLVHRTETTGPGARIAHDHEGRCPLRPALHAIRAFSALAHRFQVQFFD